MILGIDEVGRGPWAGPLVVGAVVLPDGLRLEGLTDSKKITAKKRIVLDEQIKNVALGWGLGWVSAEELDSIGLSAALRLATTRAVEEVGTPYHEIIIDGTINFLSETSKGQYVKTMSKADFLIPAVSAASIIAKVARDTYMEEQALLYPEYGFESHVGYGTAKHTQALQEYGVTPLHRRSFAPIARLVQTQDEVPVRTESKAHKPSTKFLGDQAETLVANYLTSQGFIIVERNWKLKTCEIDIVAVKKEVTYFVEVKYRSSDKQGGGIEAITTKKLQQMTYAAELYSTRHQASNDQKLMVASVTPDMAINLLEVS